MRNSVREIMGLRMCGYLESLAGPMVLSQDTISTGWKPTSLPSPRIPFLYAFQQRSSLFLTTSFPSNSISADSTSAHWARGWYLVFHPFSPRFDLGKMIGLGII